MTSDPALLHTRRSGQGLALVGYRGTGKSTVGRILATRSERPFLDADLEIEARAGRSASAILTEEGEPVFRDWEERTLAELTMQSPTAVIATGGGVVLREVNRRRLRDFGFIVWLTAEPTELATRLQADPRGLSARPSLTAAGTLAEIANILADSYAAFTKSWPTLSIDTKRQDPRSSCRPPSLAWLVSRNDVLSPGRSRTRHVSPGDPGIWIFLIGTVVGSFLNVCIYRIPWQKSVIWPSSRCPACLGAIAARDNIPIIELARLARRVPQLRRSDRRAVSAGRSVSGAFVPGGLPR